MSKKKKLKGWELGEAPKAKVAVDNKLVSSVENQKKLEAEKRKKDEEQKSLERQKELKRFEEAQKQKQREKDRKLAQKKKEEELKKEKERLKKKVDEEKRKKLEAKKRQDRKDKEDREKQEVERKRRDEQERIKKKQQEEERLRLKRIDQERIAKAQKGERNSKIWAALAVSFVLVLLLLLIRGCDGCGSITTPIGTGSSKSLSDVKATHESGGNDLIITTPEPIVTRTTWYFDGDGDGFGNSSNSIIATNKPIGLYSTKPGDCNDSDSSINPGAKEICNNGFDDNCNGFENESCQTPTHSVATTSISVDEYSAIIPPQKSFDCLNWNKDFGDKCNDVYKKVEDGRINSECNCVKNPISMKASKVDTDNDGISDDIDRCPSRIGKGSESGCPKLSISTLGKALAGKSLVVSVSITNEVLDDKFFWSSNTLEIYDDVSRVTKVFSEYVGKQTIDVKVVNGQFQMKESMAISFEISKTDLSNKLFALAKYGNIVKAGVTDSVMQEKNNAEDFIKNSITSNVKLLRVSGNKDIKLKNINRLLNELLLVKNSASSKINSITVESIDYDSVTGKINLIKFKQT